MSELRPISQEQAKEILSGPRDIPRQIAGEIGERLRSGEPLVNEDAFNQFVESHMALRHESNIDKLVRRTGRQIIELGATSLYMAHMLAGDIKIPRPRRLGEHNQSVTNVFDHTFGKELNQPRDKVLPVFTTIFQDGGKSYGVAVDGTSKNQKVHNLAIMRNILPHTEALSRDQKKVMETLALKDMVGSAIRKYHDKELLFEDAISDAQQAMRDVRNQFPGSYKDRAELYVDAVFRADAGAHTQHPAARYVNIATGKIEADVSNANRKVTNEKGLPMTLDRLFSEAPGDIGKLRYHRPKDLEVVQRLFPSIYSEGGRK